MQTHPFQIIREMTSPEASLRHIDLSALPGESNPLHPLPFSIRILLENVLRNFDGSLIRESHIEAVLNWESRQGRRDIPFMPARILMQDFTGVPAVVDIAALRSEMMRRGLDPGRIEPRIPVDLVIDHSVQVDEYASSRALEENIRLEYQRNSERYSLLKWAQQAFDGFSVLPPGMGICHQVNLEYLAKVVQTRDGMIFPDTLLGTDSHTPMVNGIGVLGWGVGGIEAEAAMLGQPLYFTLPEVVGIELKGSLPLGTTTTDLVLHITELLRKLGVVGKFVEFHGDGLDALAVPDRATIANMSPEFGCTASYFPIDDQTLAYLRATGRSEEQISLIERYARQNLLWRTGEENIHYSEEIEIDLGKVTPSLAGPSRPQDRISLQDLPEKVSSFVSAAVRERAEAVGAQAAGAQAVGAGPVTDGVERSMEDEGRQKNPEPNAVPLHSANAHEGEVRDGSVVIAAITSCTNTSNPDVMLAAGLVAKKAVEAGLRIPSWVKTSLAPGSRVVTSYLDRAGLLSFLEALGFHVVGYGCTTCIGNSGDLPPRVGDLVRRNKLAVASVLSGNRNFEARIHPDVKMNFLASPPLVVAYALAGRVDLDLGSATLGYDPNGKPISLQEIWPSQAEIQAVKEKVFLASDFREVYRSVYSGDERWKSLSAPTSEVYSWSDDSTYINEAPFFVDLPDRPKAPDTIRGARALLVLGDSVTTDHISPAGKFSPESPAGAYLLARGVEPAQFNTYGSRRGNHNVMMRGTFANVRLKNDLAQRRGGYTLLLPDMKETTVWEAAEEYRRRGVPLVVLAGKEYGSGSSRDWAAKGTSLLGVKAVIAESYERIHRSNLVGMGVLPLQFQSGENRSVLGLSGREEFTIEGISAELRPGSTLKVSVRGEDGAVKEFSVRARLDSEIEVEYYLHGGVLQYVLRRYISKS